RRRRRDRPPPPARSCLKSTCSIAPRMNPSTQRKGEFNMCKKFITTSFAAIGLALGCAAVGARGAGNMQITEFCSNSGVGNFEFVEFTNTGDASVDMTGWSEDDSTRTPNKTGHILSAFGTVQPGESVIFTEATPDNFRNYWWGSVAAAPAGL